MHFSYVPGKLVHVPTCQVFNCGIRGGRDAKTFERVDENTAKLLIIIRGAHKKPVRPASKKGRYQNRVLIVSILLESSLQHLFQFEPDNLTQPINIKSV